MASSMHSTPARETLAAVPLGTREDAQYTARQLEMTARWSFFQAAQYQTCEFDWDGRKRTRPHETDYIARQGYVPSGFVDVGGATKSLEELPSRFRHPAAPYHLVRSLVLRFTSLLFGDQTHPTIEVQDDWATSDYVQGLLEVTRWWSWWGHARNFGGGQGSACVVFTIVNGLPVLEVLDPRWVTPTFVDPRTRELAAIEYRYPFTVDERGRDGKVRPVAYVYRRLITAQSDVVYRPLRADDLQAQWVEEEARSDHQLGEVPAVWVGNTKPSDGGIDGDPDGLGIFDLAREIDALLSQSSVGVKANCDPTTVVASNLDLDAVKKGSKYALKVGAGETVTYLESTGSGATSARDQALLLRRLALEVAQAVIDNPDQAEATATEVDRRFQAMYSHLNTVREQYAEEGVKPLLAKLLRAVRTLAARGLAVLVPPMVETDGEVVMTRPREVGIGSLIKLTWPGWTKPSAQEAGVAASSVATAVGAKVMDRSTAVTYLAPMFGGGDPAEIERRIDQEQAQSMDAEAQRMLGAMAGAAPAAPPADKLPDISIEDLKADLCSVNEYRHARGLGQMEGADVVLSEWERLKAQHGQQGSQASGLAAPQIAAMMSIVTSVAGGVIPREVGIAVLLASLPLTADQAAAILPPSMVPVPPPAPMLPMSPPPGPPPGPPGDPGAPL